ncbi:MAG TPA: glycosyltransferase family 9 protein [Opitutaceae bacterium]|nr:glycosyltransferase family 9 protein [Opitutaceae bacterium]
MPVQPKTIVYLRPDTIGDLILFTPALSQFIAEWPSARHVIVVREGYESLAPLFPKALEWKVARLNPFRQRPSECRGELEALLAELAAIKPDLILAPTLNRTWLELAVAAHFGNVRSVVLGGAEVDPIFAASLRLDLGVEAAASFGETVAAEKSAGDVESQHRFAEKLIGRALPTVLPSIEVSGDLSQKARAIAAGHGLAEGRWAAVFPGGLANVPLKSWPAAGFAEVVAWLQAKGKTPVLLLAHADEASAVEDVASKVEAFGGARPPAWLGRNGELPLLAALLRDSGLYVGHDTGAMHMAGAVGRPVVGVFGGGHWPRFRPSAKQAVSVVQPLPCFGCNWDCHFGDGPCVKTIPASDVIQAVKQTLSAGSQPLDAVVESHALPPEAVRLISATTPGIIALKRDRVDRQHKIEELKDETDSKDVEIGALKRAAEERKIEMEAIKAELEQECADKDKEIAELKGETNSKDLEIADLKRAAEERKAEMEAIKAELEEECADKDKEIAELKRETNRKDSEIADLKETCDERERTVVRLDAGLKAHIAALPEWERRVAHAEAERAALSGRLELLGKLPADALTWAQAVRDKDVHISNIEGILKNREEEIALLRESIANYAGGYVGTELAKHYGRLLTEKEAVIQELHRACVERQEVIGQLAADATAPTARLRKLWIGFSFGVRERIWRPLCRRTFKRIVEDYWMKIGILRQYEPRPISWDSRIGRRRAADAALPRIGIVTPSFGQPAFLESTMLSILNQEYPKLLYVVQDGGSRDRSPEIIARHAARLRHWASEPDRGQADAVRKGFARIEPELGPDDLMAWFNSDDLAAPRALGFVAAYFADHPLVDVVYGHRIIIDHADREIGRWIMPRHEPDSLEWIDYVPQETLFWRKRAWDTAGGIDPSFQFALDWDLLARFHLAGCRIVRIPYFLGCFRVHDQQKTSQVIHTTGAEEMARIRLRFHGPESDNAAMIERHARRIRLRGALAARLHAAGLRW